MKNAVIPIVSATTLIVVGVAAYHFLSPKVVVINRSSVPIQEATIRLPASGMTFGAVEPGGTSTIYYSPQQVSGTLNYSVQVMDTAQSDSLPYSDSGEYGRVIQIEIDAEGSVTAEIKDF